MRFSCKAAGDICCDCQFNLCGIKMDNSSALKMFYFYDVYGAAFFVHHYVVDS